MHPGKLSPGAMRARIAFWACLALPFLLWCIPTTRWAVAGQVRRAFGQIDWASFGLKESDLEDAWMLPQFYDRLPAGTSREARLIRAGNLLDDAKPSISYAAARENWTDPDFLVCYFHTTKYRAATIASNEPETGDWNAVAKDRIDRHADWLNMREASIQGMKLEPDNAYFYAMGAAVEDALGNLDACLDDLDRARACTRWNDHAKELTEIQRRVMPQQFGYRGWEGWVQLAVPPNTWRQSVARLARGLSRRPHDAKVLQAMRGLIHAAGLAYQVDYSVYGDYLTATAAAGIISGLADPGPVEGLKYSEILERQLTAIDRLSRQIEPQSPNPLALRLREIMAVKDLDRIRNDHATGLPENPYEEHGDVVYAPFTGYGIGAMMMAGAVALLLLIGVTRLVSRLPGFWLPPAALPAAGAVCATLFASWADFEYGPKCAGVTATYGLFYCCIGIVSVRPHLEKFAAIAGVLIPAAATAAVLLATNPELQRNNYQGQTAIVCIYAGLLVWRAIWLRLRPFRLFLIPQFCVLLFGFLSVFIAGPLTSLTRTGAGLAGLLIAVVVFVAALQRVSLAEASRQIRRYAYWVVAAAALGVSGTAVWQVYADRGQREMLRREESLSPLIRSWAHAHPDQPLALIRQQEGQGITYHNWP